MEVRLDSTLQQDQESWVRAERVMESPILVNALELLGGGQLDFLRIVSR